VEGYIEHYNNVRLNSAVGYITPKDMLVGRQQEIHAETGPEVGGCQETTADSSAASRLTNCCAWGAGTQLPVKPTSHGLIGGKDRANQHENGVWRATPIP